MIKLTDSIQKIMQFYSVGCPIPLYRDSLNLIQSSLFMIITDSVKLKFQRGRIVLLSLFFILLWILIYDSIIYVLCVINANYDTKWLQLVLSLCWNSNGNELCSFHCWFVFILLWITNYDFNLYIMYIWCYKVGKLNDST